MKPHVDKIFEDQVYHTFEWEIGEYQIEYWYPESSGFAKCFVIIFNDDDVIFDETESYEVPMFRRKHLEYLQPDKLINLLQSNDVYRIMQYLKC